MKFYGSQEFWRGDVINPFKTTILMSNHVSYADWPVLFFVSFRKHASGILRIFMKSAGKYVPGMGWTCYFHEYFFVEKSWSRDGQRLSSQLNTFRVNKTPLWVGIFPEGTFTDAKSTEIVRAAHEFADKNGIQKFHHVLVPRVKGFHLLVESLRGLSNHIVDMTIVFSGCNHPYQKGFNTYLPLIRADRHLPSLYDYLNGCGPSSISVHIKLWPIDSIPADENGCKEWLFKKFQIKEQLLAYYYQHQSFPSENNNGDIPIDPNSQHQSNGWNNKEGMVISANAFRLWLCFVGWVLYGSMLLYLIVHAIPIVYVQIFIGGSVAFLSVACGVLIFIQE